MKAITFAILLAASATAADLDSLIGEIRKEVRPDEAMTFMKKVYANDRYFTFPRFRATAEYLKQQMQDVGLKNVEIAAAPADGVTQAGYWTMPLAWDVKSARLQLLDTTVDPARRILADFEKIPSSLGMWSGPTPPQGVEAEIVEWKRGADVKGKLVLTRENPAGIKHLLVKAGALGAINTFTENPTLLDGRQWINAWGDDGWAYTKRSTPLLCFSITPRQTEMLRALLAKGTVRAKATVDTRYYNGEYPYVTGIIPGTGPEEVLTLGHTAEQGAQDNATGVAATVEALATLQRLIAAGKLPPPKRAIRVLSMGEMYGSMHYVEHNRERIRRTVAAMCVDTPAASYDIAGTEYTFYMNPHVAKDYTDAFVLKIAASYLPKVKRPWHEKEFTTGTDTYLAEPMVGIPTVWGYSGSGVETHHNSEDTPDRVDPRSLRDITVITAAYLYFIANAGEPEALYLARLAETRGYEQILKATDSNSIEKIRYILDRESHAVRSAQRLVNGSIESQTAPMIERLKAFAKLQESRIANPAPPVQPAPEGKNIVVKRKRFGTIPLDDLPHDQWEGYPSGAWAAIPTLALYWCDGNRSVAEVARLTQLELGPTKFDFVGYFRFLRKKGYVDFKD